MNKSDYKDKMLDNLLNNECYKKLSREPNNKIMKEVTTTIKESSLDEEIKAN
jgi:hypothetical protein